MAEEEVVSDWAARTITNAKSPEELRWALQVIRADEDFALDGLESSDSHGGFVRYRPRVQEIMLRMRDAHPDYPPVPTGEDSVDYVNWCIDANKCSDAESATGTMDDFADVKAEPAKGEGAAKGAAAQIIDLCDEILSLGRKEGFVGQHKRRSGPSGIVGRMGLAWDEQWDALAQEFDKTAERIAVLVRVIDTTYPVKQFYGAEPQPWIAKVPGGRVRMPDHERETHLDHMLCLSPGRPRAEIEKDHAAFVAGMEQLQTDRAREAFTKPQWPGFVFEVHDKAAKIHQCFISTPELVRDFEERYGPLREWAAERARQAGDAKAAGQNNETPEVPTRWKSPRRKVRAPTEWQKKIAKFYENSDTNQTQAAKHIEEHQPRTKKWKRVSQSTVSRAIKAVNRFRDANPDLGLPQIPTRRRKVDRPVAPGKIDMGARTDSRGHSQRLRAQQRRKDK